MIGWIFVVISLAIIAGIAVFGFIIYVLSELERMKNRD